MRNPRIHRGFTILEVLIAILIFSLGLLGTAGLMVLSVRTNHSAYLRTQASFLAGSMAERMRTNVGWTNTYNGTYDASTVGAESCAATACTPAQLVARDQAVWSQQLVDSLPQVSANINCTGANLGAGIQQGAAPYNGLCAMTITWVEADLDRTATPGTPATQTFAWVFQP